MNEEIDTTEQQTPVTNTIPESTPPTSTSQTVEPPTTTADITPAAVTNVSFNEQIANVNQAIQDRNTASKEAYAALHVIGATVRKYQVNDPLSFKYIVTTELVNPSDIRSSLANFKVHQPAKEFAPQVKELGKMGYFIRFNNSQSSRALSILNEKFPGFASFISDLEEYLAIEGSPFQVDEEATKTARIEIDAAIDVYEKAFTTYNDAQSRLNDVNQYINVIEKIANISAITSKNDKSNK